MQDPSKILKALRWNNLDHLHYNEHLVTNKMFRQWKAIIRSNKQAKDQLSPDQLAALSVL